MLRPAGVGADTSFLIKDKQIPEQTDNGISKEGNWIKEGRIHRQLVYLRSALTTSKSEEKRLTSIIFRSLVLQIVSVLVLFLSLREPLLLVWRISFIISYGCFIWVAFLSESLGNQSSILVCITYGLLLASWADTYLNPGIGMLIVHLNSHFVTGLLGYALAERLQRNGIERSAFDIPIPTSTNDKEAKRLRFIWFLVWLSIGIPMYCILADMVGLIWYSANYSRNELLSHTLVLLPVALLFGIVIVAMLLRGALISGDQIAYLMFYFIFVALLRAVCKGVLDEVVGIVIIWVTVLVLSGIFGYCLSVLYSFKRFMRSEIEGRSSCEKHAFVFSL